MIVTLELKPEIEGRVTDLAARQGISVKDYIQNLLESLTSLNEETAYDSLTPDEWAKEFEEWLDSHYYITALPLSDEAISREGIYSEREDNQV